MAAETAEEGAVEQAGFAEHPGQQRQFESHSHCKKQGKEVVHIAAEAHYRPDGIAYCVLGEKAQGQWKNYEVAYRRAGIEQQISTHESLAGSALFVGVQGWSHKSPYEVQHNWKANNKCAQTGGCQMRKELAGQLHAYDIDVEIADHCIVGHAGGGCYAVEQAICGEPGVARSQYEVVEKPGHGSESRSAKHEQNNDNAEQNAPQSICVVPKTAFVVAHFLETV